MYWFPLLICMAQIYVLFQYYVLQITIYYIRLTVLHIKCPANEGNDKPDK